jgi:hypothetical protein
MSEQDNRSFEREFTASKRLASENKRKFESIDEDNLHYKVQSSYRIAKITLEKSKEWFNVSFSKLTKDNKEIAKGQFDKFNTAMKKLQAKMEEHTN